MLLQNRLNEKGYPKSVVCYLCHLRGGVKKPRVTFGCWICGKGFHVNCFAAYHYAGMLHADTKAKMDVLNSREERRKFSARPAKETISMPSEIRLWSQEDSNKSKKTKVETI